VGYQLELARDDDSLRTILAKFLEHEDALAKLPPLGTPGLRSRVGVLEHAGARYAVKRYDYPLVYAARTLGIRSRARREFEALAAIAPLVPVPVRPVAWGELRTCGLAFRSLVVTELLPGAIDLKAWRLAFEKGQRPEGERAKLVAALPELARLVRRLHENGVFGATLFEKNVLWRPAAEAREAFSFIDLPFARKRSKPLDRAHAAYDLACLDKGARPVLRRTERLALYLAYQGRERLQEEDRDLLERVERDRIRREHGTWLRWRLRLLKKRVKRTAAGKLLTGRDPDAGARPS
jgi:hypothetical protein